MPVLAAVLAVGLLVAHGTGWAQSQFSGARGRPSARDSLQSVQSQIRRYGCNKPQYARSVEGCRQLNARARALAGAGGRRPVSRSAVRAPQPRQSRGFFGRLFGAPSPSRARPVTQDRVSHTGGIFSWFDWDRSDTREAQRPRYGSRYRTLCVRLCDGYYWPMNYSVARSGFGADAERCQNTCDSPARLFVHANPGGSTEHMYDLQGNAYTSLDNAYLYREEFLPDCRCKPEPWTEEARQVYEERALAEADRKDAEESEEAEKTSPARVVQAQPAPAARTWRQPVANGRHRPRYDTHPRRRRGLFGFWR